MINMENNAEVLGGDHSMASTTYRVSDSSGSTPATKTFEIWFECGEESDCAHEEIDAASMQSALDTYIATYGICGCGRGADKGWGTARVLMPDPEHGREEVCWQIIGTHGDGQEFQVSAFEIPATSIT